MGRPSPKTVLRETGTEDTGRSAVRSVGVSIAVIDVSLAVAVAFTGAAAAFHAADSQTQTGGEGITLDHNNSSGHSHKDDPPDNERNPDDPPCDADHGHPGNNSEQCDDGPPENGNGNGDLGTCEQDGLVQNETIANSVFGTENESGLISSGIHGSENETQGLEPVVHEASCVVATVDNNFAEEEE